MCSGVLHVYVFEDNKPEHVSHDFSNVGQEDKHEW